MRKNKHPRKKPSDLTDDFSEEYACLAERKTLQRRWIAENNREYFKAKASDPLVTDAGFFREMRSLASTTAALWYPCKAIPKPRP